MPKKKLSLGIIRKIGLTLPGVEESTAFGAFALKVRGKLMACVPTNRAAEPNSLMVRMDDEDRDALLAEAPDAYYLPDHYAGFHCVLVRRAQVTPDVMRDLLGLAHKFMIRNTARPASAHKSR